VIDLGSAIRIDDFVKSLVLKQVQTWHDEQRGPSLIKIVDDYQNIFHIPAYFYLIFHIQQHPIISKLIFSSINQWYSYQWWSPHDELILLTGIARSQPHATFSSYIHGFESKWTLLCHNTPSISTHWSMQVSFQPLLDDHATLTWWQA